MVHGLQLQRLMAGKASQLGFIHGGRRLRCGFAIYHRRSGSKGPRTRSRVNMELSSIPSPQSIASTSHFENISIGKRGVIFKNLIQEVQSATPSVETAVHIYICAFNSKFRLPALRQRMASFKVDNVSQHHTLKDKN